MNPRNNASAPADASVAADASTPSASIGRLVDQALIDAMPAGLRAAVDRLLARGARPGAVLAFVEAAAARAAAGDPNKGKLTVAAVEAYLRRCQEGGAA